MYKTILIPIDLDQESSWQRALPIAVEYSQIFGSRLHAATVLPDLGSGVVGSYFPPDFEEKAGAEARDKLEALVREKVPSNIDVTCHVVHGTAYEEILCLADDIGADLIVMASHRPELKDYLIGPNAARVVRHAKVSVLVVRG
ncbi:MAG: universal stress protein [Alphaproteobacteria bacterium]|nr:universal stress protein [Alphaproteobacteria bacterium]